ncbi:MAG: iron ABC transporter permease [Anaerolineaceae bacterium]|nr:iron ABC transporter permease [Chloroflexota bacterium]
MKIKQNSTNNQYRQWLWLLSILLFVGIFVSLSLGRYSNDPLKVLNVLLARMGANVNVDPTMDSIVFNVRLPRIIASVMIGAMLSLSGTVYQSVFRNPLVSPDLLGVSSGAAVGAAGAILLGAGLVTRQLFAFTGGMLAVLITSMVPRILRNRSNMMLVLSGIIVGGFFSSVLAIMKFVAEEQTELSSIVFWQMGSLSSILGRELLAILPVFVICSSLLLMLSWRINILAFGDLEAQTLGVNVRQVRSIVVVCASLLTASAVSISGTIGWIGLVVPHLGRLLVGSDNTRSMPLAILIGSLFMLLIDTLARTATSMEIPLSILTGFVGAPLYAFLLYKQKTRLE